MRAPMKIFYPVVSRTTVLFFIAALLLGHAGLRAGEFDIIINELNYNVFDNGGEDSLEFIELYNRGGTVVDLSGWDFSRGVDFTFSAGTMVEPGEYLVLSPDPAAAAARYGLQRVLGPYLGQLDNGGEIVELLNSKGQMISRVHYDDSTPWSGRPDGRGPSLEFTGVDNANGLARNWKPSKTLGGTPGRVNSRRVLPSRLSQRGPRPIVSSQGIWRTFAGRSNPSDPLDAWTRLDFDDEDWGEAQGGFGYGQRVGFNFSTQISNMRREFNTYYIRSNFTVTEETLAAITDGSIDLSLTVSYDDAFVAYVNGTEVARDNVGDPGEPVAFDATGDESRNETARVELPGIADLLVEGENVLALQGVNATRNSRDFYIAADLLMAENSQDEKEDESANPYIGRIINELLAGEGDDPGFIELFNPEDEELDLSGNVLLSSRGNFLYEIPGGTVLAPGEFVAFDSKVLALPVPAGGARYVLLAADGRTVLDDIDVEIETPGRSVGRFPEGDEDVYVLDQSTNGAANTYAYSSPVVINEIHFHPPYVPAGKDCSRQCSDARQWVELLNRSEEAVDLGGWKLTNGIRYTFEPGTILAAGAYLVVASSLEEFSALHDGVENVVGDWSGRLNHATETINLRDGLGNRVDRVIYGDGGAKNDEDPDDGVDDRTFRGSTWPILADGDGPTIELINPGLGNRAGVSWRASNDAGGTPGSQNSVFEADPAPSIRSVKHSPAVPRSDEAVVVTCSISALDALTEAEVQWSIAGGPSGNANLRDDGAGPDELAQDGVFSASIPAQDDGDIVRFSVVAATGAGGRVRLPLEPEADPFRGFQGVFYLYEVDNSNPPDTGAAVFRIIMNPNDSDELEDRDEDSNVLLPATLICDGEIYYCAGVRYRGENSRRLTNKAFKIKLPPENSCKGIGNINLLAGNGNDFGTSTFNELLASDLYRRAGEPYPQEWNAVLHFAGVVGRNYDTRYIRKEAYDDDFLTRFFGGNSGGNLYRPMDPGGLGGFGGGRIMGNLEYQGSDPEDYRRIYDKRSNEDEDDFSDVIELTRMFDADETPQAEFRQRAEELIDVRQWARFFAIMACVTNTDGGIWNDGGEDYFLYRMPADADRPDAGKWLILCWDLEETFTGSNERLFRPEADGLQRFFAVPEFARLYYEELLIVRRAVFSRAQMRQRYGYAEVMFPPEDVYDVVDEVDTTVTERLGYFDANITLGVEGGARRNIDGGSRLIDTGESWRYFRGTEDPPGDGLAWTRLGYDDEAWETGESGFGYGDGDDATVLGDMRNNYTTVFIRKTFELEDPAAIEELTLIMDYDDAFVAFINGEEIARSDNAPDGAVDYESTSTSNHEAGDDLDRFNISMDKIRAGENVLAILGINGDLPSSDFSLIPVLTSTLAGAVAGPTGGCGDSIYTTGSTIILAGLADPVNTRSVVVRGREAALDMVSDGNGPYGLRWQVEVSGLEPGENLVEIIALDGEAGKGEPIASFEAVIHRFEGDFREYDGTLDGDEEWTAEGGPYRLRGDVRVPDGTTLRIRPGAVVLADAGASIIVSGELRAEGSEESPIIMRAFSCADEWGGIAFNETGTDEDDPTHLLSFCDIRGGSNPDDYEGCIAPTDSRLLVTDCHLENIPGNAIDGVDAVLEVRRTTIRNIFEGIHCEDSDTIVLDTIIENMTGNSDAIDFDGSGSGRSRIQGCIFYGSSDDGVDLGEVSVDIKDNIFVDIADKAISIEDVGDQGHPTISGNLIVRCGTGMAIKNGITISEGDHNTITECQEGIALFAKDESNEGGHATFHSVICWGNAIDVIVDELSTVSFDFSNIGMGEWPGEGNLSVDPLFLDPAGLDYTLAAGSLCIGTGREGSDMGAFSFEGGGPDPEDTVFLRADANLDGEVDVSDAIATLDYLFRGGPGPDCLDVMDANDDGQPDVSDAVFLLRYLFSAGSPPPAPFPESGTDQTPDGLWCPAGPAN